MENASHALLIAGGILIALLIVGSLVMLFANLQDYQNQNDVSVKQAQIADFNNQFEPFNKTGLTLMELKSIYNKITSNNTKHPEYKIEHNIDIALINNKADPLNGDIANIFFTGDFRILPEPEKINRRFKCSLLEYENEGGRISKMEFEDTTPPVTSWTQ